MRVLNYEVEEKIFAAEAVDVDNFLDLWEVRHAGKRNNDNEC
jgi:hypothetical protein